MKRILTAFSLALLLIVTQNASAQLKKFRVGLGLEGALPTGNFNNNYSAGGGLSARFELRPLHNLALNATAGVMIFAPKHINSGYDIKPQVNIPVKVGVKYIFVGHLYGMIEAGTTNSHVYYVEPNTTTVKDAHTNNFTWAPGIGLQLIGFDIGLRYESFGDSHFTAVRLGFGL